jgi:Arc/MetJ-type ribon-helix-helix transcriptional regulator
MRVNARFDDEAERQIRDLTESTGFGVSHVVREAIALYYQQVVDRRDAWHERAKAQAYTAQEGWVTIWPVFAEACRLLQRE